MTLLPLIFIELQLMYNAVFISAAQQGDTVVHIYFHFYILSYYGLSQDTKYSCLCYQQDCVFIHSICNSFHHLTSTSQSILPPPLLLLGNHKTLLYVYETVCFIDKLICVIYFRFHVQVLVGYLLSLSDLLH